ncbi:hypothetical protein NKG94_36760 [Micromonospora sp. M12]
MARGEVPMRDVERLVEQQYAMLLRRDVARLPDLYARRRSTPCRG